MFSGEFLKGFYGERKKESDAYFAHCDKIIKIENEALELAGGMTVGLSKVEYKREQRLLLFVAAPGYQRELAEKVFDIEYNQAKKWS